jgi:hypothetical protein
MTCWYAHLRARRTGGVSKPAEASESLATAKASRSRVAVGRNTRARQSGQESGSCSGASASCFAAECGCCAVIVSIATAGSQTCGQGSDKTSIRMTSEVGRRGHMRRRLPHESPHLKGLRARSLEPDTAGAAYPAHHMLDVGLVVQALLRDTIHGSMRTFLKGETCSLPYTIGSRKGLRRQTCRRRRRCWSS